MSHFAVQSTGITAGISRSLAAILVSSAALISACAPLPQEGAAYNAAAAEAGREKAMRKQWVDKPYRELVKHMGHEGFIMDIPRYGWPPSSAVVYGTDNATGCVDAFLVVHGKEPLIKDYFCR